MRIVEYRPRDASKLARLWNRSDSGWPAGLVRLRPKTAGDWREWERRVDSLARYVAFDRDRAVGFARLLEWFDSPDATYVQWLDVEPAYQGRGIGKELLRRCIDRTVALGYPRIDLHTWPGNDRAMALYKRTGFQWVPGSHAYLQNYVPLLLRYEPAKAFLATHDWASSLRPRLDRDHDEDRLHGTDVFVYRFEADGRRIEAAIDRNARRVTAFEDERVRVEAWIPGARLPEGVPGTIRWRVRNKERVPVSVAIRPDPPPGVTVVAPPPFVLAPGEPRSLEGAVRIPDSFPDTPEDWACPVVETVFDVSGRAIPVASGFRPKAAVRIEWEGEPRAAPMGTRRVTLRLRNESGRPLEGGVKIEGEGLDLSPSSLRIRLGRSAARRIRMRISNPRAKERAARVRVRFESALAAVTQTLVVPCLGPAGRIAYADGTKWILESPAIRFDSEDVGGTGTVRAGSTDLVRFWLSAGPPFVPSDAGRERWEGRGALNEAPEIVRTFASRRRPGLVIEQRWRLVGDRILELRSRLENRGTEPWTASLALSLTHRADRPALTMPTQAGLVTEALVEGDWPDDRRDVPLDEMLREGWVHVAFPEGGVGLIWEPPGPRERLESEPGSLLRWEAPKTRLSPGEARDAPRMWIVVTSDPKEVRALWAHLSGREARAKPKFVGALHLDSAPSLVLASPAADVRLRMRNPRRRPAEGVLRIAGERVRAGTRTWTIPRLRYADEWVGKTRIAARGPDVISARFVLRTVRGEDEWELPIVASDGPGRLRFGGPREHPWVDNGFLRLRAATGHAAALTSLRAGGREYLFSSFPTPGSFSWFRPFYGGIQPLLFQEGWPGNLYKERFVARRARRGTWRGIRLDASSSRSALPKGIRVGVEYLTRPGSPFVVLGLSVENRTRERQSLTGGFWTFVGFDGTPECAVEFTRLRARRWTAAPWGGWSHADDGFAWFRAPRVPKAIAVVAAAPAELEVFDIPRQGHAGLVSGKLDVGPGNASTLLTTLALTAPSRVQGLRVLRGLRPGSFEATRAR